MRIVKQLIIGQDGSISNIIFTDDENDNNVVKFEDGTKLKLPEDGAITYCIDEDGNFVERRK